MKNCDLDREYNLVDLSEGKNHEQRALHRWQCFPLRLRNLITSCKRCLVTEFDHRYRCASLSGTMSNEWAMTRCVVECCMQINAEVIALRHFRWLTNVFVCPPIVRHFVQCKTGRSKATVKLWSRCTKKLALSLVSVGPSRYSGWDPRKEECRWLETVRGNAAWSVNRSRGPQKKES